MAKKTKTNTVTGQIPELTVTVTVTLIVPKDTWEAVLAYKPDRVSDSDFIEGFLDEYLMEKWKEEDPKAYLLDLVENLDSMDIEEGIMSEGEIEEIMATLLAINSKRG
jgi:hypothetical protein